MANDNTPSAPAPIELSVDSCVLIDIAVRQLLTAEEDLYARGTAEGLDPADEYVVACATRIGTLRQLVDLFALSPRVYVQP